MPEDLSPGVDLQALDAGRRQAEGWGPVAAGRCKEEGREAERRAATPAEPMRQPRTWFHDHRGNSTRYTKHDDEEQGGR